MDKCHELLDSLDRRIHAAVLRIPQRRPWIAQERDEIRRVIRECLGVRDEWIPTVKADVGSETRCGPVSVQTLRATSWPRCFSPAHLFLPTATSAGSLPLVILCCGHGQGGKQAPGYQAMARLLASMGMAVLVPDNLGQGERAPMGHRDVVAPFRCGISLQGLIVMETIGWLRWALADTRFDRARIAAIGNSGGGTLSMFLGALCGDDLAALSSSGYPSSFAFIAAKEKKHCHCNLLPGIVGQLEMWQVLGCFAPKPMFLFQGRMDPLFPEDIFDVTCRKIQRVYGLRNAESAPKTSVFPGEHPWDDERRLALAAFLADTLGAASEANPQTLTPGGVVGNCYSPWPEQAISTEDLAAQVTGIATRENDRLYEVYFPQLAAYPDMELRRVKFRQLAAQQQAFLSPAMRLSNTSVAGDG